MRGFQVVLLLIFGGFTVLAVMIFAGIIPIGQDDLDRDSELPVLMWGSIPEETFKDIITGGQIIGEQYNITYVYKDPRDFEENLINALASGRGPDLAIFPHTLIEKQKDKLFPIQYAWIPERTFRDAFVEGAEIYLRANDMLGFPLYVDPIVMYWNRDLFTREGLVQAPTAWVELQLLPAKLTKLDGADNIIQATIPFGGIRNVTHFKDIISALFLQTGTGIAKRHRIGSDEGGFIDSVLVTLSSEGSAGSALRYFTQFANPTLPNYSWNSAKRNSFDEFLAGKVAVYLGRASDLDLIRERNPHLNFDVAVIPQIKDSQNRATYGEMYALVMMRNTQNFSAAFAVGSKFAYGNMAAVVAEQVGLPPVRRDLLAAGSQDIYQSVFYESAKISRAWLDPHPLVTLGFFQEMVENVLIGKADAAGAVGNVAELLEEMF